MLTRISKTGSWEPGIHDTTYNGPNHRISTCHLKSEQRETTSCQGVWLRIPENDWVGVGALGSRFLRYEFGYQCLMILNHVPGSCEHGLFNKIYNLGHRPKVVRSCGSIFGCVLLKREVGNEHARAWKLKNVPLNENKQLHLLRTWLSPSSSWNVIYTVPSKPGRILWSVTKGTWKVMSGTGKGSCLFLMIPDSLKKSQFT